MLIEWTLRLIMWLLIAVYMVSTVGLIIYGLNCYVMLILFARKRHAAETAGQDLEKRLKPLLERHELPVVTTQIAIYNELNVAERAIRAACAMRYPAGRHEVQVLDDSTDETRQVVERVAAEMRAAGHDVKVAHRDNRAGFKAGALAEGLAKARGLFVAMFDADFVPPEDYLMRTVPFFLEDDRLGLVQARWEHLNRRRSLVTRAQSIGIDGHFVIEQVARCWNGLYMNFNGTAGIWRREAIVDAGGWHSDTLTEDLDLSYRVQFRGWKTLYLPDLVVPAELPEDINALRAQQFRWAKGSMQTLIKLFPQLRAAPVSFFKKFEAVLHMGGYLVHPMMFVLSLLALPALSFTTTSRPMSWMQLILAIPICFSVIAPSTMYLISQKAAHEQWLRRMAMLPMLIVVGIGLAFSNTRAIVEAFTSRRNEWTPTPKCGDRSLKVYRIRLTHAAWIEIALGVYGVITFAEFLQAGRTVVSPFLGLYPAGFLFIGILTLIQDWTLRRRARAAVRAG